MAEPSRIESWNNVKNRKSQRDLDKIWDELFGAKVIDTRQENGITIKIIEPR